MSEKKVKTRILDLFSGRTGPATIEDVQAFGRSLGEVAEAAAEIDADQDKQIAAQEVLAFVGVLVTEALARASVIGQVVKLIPTSEGRDAFKAGFAEGFDLRNDAQESAVEKIIDTIDVVIDTFEEAKAAFAAS